MKKQNANEWLEVLANQIGGKEDTIPDGWMTMYQIKDEMGMTIGQAETFMNRAVKLGKVEKKKFRTNTEGAGVRDVWHYNKKK
jgi:hypothetical protein